MAVGAQRRGLLASIMYINRLQARVDRPCDQSKPFFFFTLIRLGTCRNIG